LPHLQLIKATGIVEASREILKFNMQAGANLVGNNMGKFKQFAYHH